MVKLSVSTSQRNEMIDITSSIQKAIAQDGMKNGGCIVHVPHTTAGITINENADPDVVRDIIVNMKRVIPERGDYQHSEGNSDSHIKSTLFGPSLYLIIENGQLQLGTWQGVYFCEFDGPRHRQYWIQFLRF
jgi:secondary thiamine-phosphate synthase enzyme